METYGARCIASPSNETRERRAILAKDPNNPGSLGIAISEAVEMAAKDPAVKYSLGSVLNPCCCTRPSSARRQSSSSRWRATIPTSSSLHRRRLELLRPRLPVPRPAAARRP